MAMILKQAVNPVRGGGPTSAQMGAFADAINSRILTGAGDAHWRIPYYIFSVFFRKPRLDKESLFMPETEFFDFYQFVNPNSKLQETWPVAEAQSPEGANLQTNNLNKFIFGMNYQKKSGGAYIFEREDVRAGKAQDNLRNSAAQFRGFVFPYFSAVGLFGDPQYSAFGMASEYLSNGYVNGNTVNPSGHSYGGYYGTVPNVINGLGCGKTAAGKGFPSSELTLYKIDTNLKFPYTVCAAGVGPINPPSSYNNISFYPNDYIVYNKQYSTTPDNLTDIEKTKVLTIASKNFYHLGQYNSNVYLRREAKNYMLRVLYNYICNVKNFDFDWFFRNQYAYAPEIGSFLSAEIYFDENDEFLDLKNIRIDQRRLLFSTVPFVDTAPKPLILNDFSEEWNKTISSGAYIKVYQFTTDDHDENPSDLAKKVHLGNISGTDNILRYLNLFGYLSKAPPASLYTVSNYRVKVPSGFAFHSFNISAPNIKKVTVTLQIFGSQTTNPIEERDYSFDFSSKNFLSQVVEGFVVGNIAVSFYVKSVEFKSDIKTFTAVSGQNKITCANHELQVKEVEVINTKRLLLGLTYRVADADIIFDGRKYANGDTFIAEITGDYKIAVENTTPKIYEQSNSNRIQFLSDNLPSPLVKNQTYTVANVENDGFRVYIPNTQTILQFTSSGTGTFRKEGYVNINPVFLMAFRPKIEDAYALLRAATYHGMEDAEFASENHPFSRIDPDTKISFCQQLSNDLKTYGYILPEHVNQLESSQKHSNDTNVELNTNAVFEAMRRMSLFTRILNPKFFDGIATDVDPSGKTLRFNRYAGQTYSWGRLKYQSSGTSVIKKLPYTNYRTVDISNSKGYGYDPTFEDNIVLKGDIKIPLGIYNFLKSTYDGQSDLVFDASNEEQVKSEFFVANYYTAVDIYDFSNEGANNAVGELNYLLISSLSSLTQGNLDLERARQNNQFKFSALSLYIDYDFLIVSADVALSKTIYCRFQNPIGDNYNDNKETRSFYRYVYNKGIVSKESIGQFAGDAPVIQEDEFSEYNNKFFVLVLQRKPIYNKTSLANYLNATYRTTDTRLIQGFFYAGKNSSIIYDNFPFNGLGAGGFPFLEANIVGVPLKHKSDNSYNSFEYFKLDQRNAYPDANSPFVSPTGSITIDVTEPTEGSNANSSITQGNKYTVESGTIRFDDIVYKAGQTFIAPVSGSYAILGNGTAVVKEFVIPKTRVFNLKLNSYSYYDDENTLVEPADPNLYSLKGILNGLITNFKEGGIYFNPLDGSFSIKNTLGNDSINSLSSVLYNQALAGFPIKFSYLNFNAEYNEPNSQKDELISSRIINNEDIDESQLWFAIYNFDDTLVANSKTYFKINETIVLPTLNNGQYLRFSIPIFDRYIYGKISYGDSPSFTSSGSLEPNTSYYLKTGKISYQDNGTKEKTAPDFFTAPDGISPIAFTDLSSSMSPPSTLLLYEATKENDKFVNFPIYLSFVNYFYSDNYLQYTNTVTRSGSLSIERKIEVYAESSDKTTLRDAFQDIVPDPDGVISGQLNVGRRYIVTAGTIEHDGVQYSGSDALVYSSFIAKNKYYTRISSGMIRVIPVSAKDDTGAVVSNIPIPNGIIENAFPESYTNEWAMWINFLPFDSSSSSPFKEDSYAATSSPFIDRCHINSYPIPKSQENKHLNLGLDLARFVEAPPSYRYMPLLDNKERISYANIVGPFFDSTKRSKFFSSCKGVVTPYKIKRAYYRLLNPNQVLIELDRPLDGQGTSDLSYGRTDFNGLEDWSSHKNKARFRVGDASITNANGANQIDSASANQYKGSYYPRFFFIKLIPKPYNKDGNNIVDPAYDSEMNHDHIKQAELYIEAMREGFSTSTMSLASVGCEQLTGHLTPPDYTYEELLFRSTSYSKINGNKWPPLLTFSNKYNTIDYEKNLYAPLRRNDNPRGFGAIPQVGTYAELFNSLVNAVNNLRHFRIAVPSEYYATFNNYRSLESQNYNIESRWKKAIPFSGTPEFWVANFSSEANVNPTLVTQTKIGLRKPDGTLLQVGVNQGYTITSFIEEKIRAHVSNAYVLREKSTAQISVEPIDSKIINEAYPTISSYLKAGVMVAMAKQGGSTGRIIKEVTSGYNQIFDSCGEVFRYELTDTKYASYGEEISTKRVCFLTKNLTVSPPKLVVGTPFFNQISWAPCNTSTAGISVNQSVNSIGFTSRNFNSAASEAVDIYESGWRIISPGLYIPKTINTPPQSNEDIIAPPDSSIS